MSRLARTVLAFTAVLASAPAAASAADFCVADQACVAAGGTPELYFQDGLDDAHGTPGRDRVVLGAGDFTATAGFVYDTPDASNSVDIVGAGRGKTRLHDTNTAIGTYTLRLTGVSKSTVAHLTIASPPVGQGGALELTGAATDVAVEGAPGGPYVLARLAGAEARLDRSFVRQTSEAGDTAVLVHQNTF